MENKHYRQKISPRKVQLCLDTQEEKESISDTDGSNVELSPHTIQSSSGKCDGDRLSETSVSTSILDDEGDPKLLRLKIQDLELKCRLLEVENEKANAELATEKTRISKMEAKLQFVKDNQEVFMRLKEAYINMKYNEAAGRKMIEIREKGIQTWEGILCKSCIETEEVRRNMNGILERYKNLFVLTPADMEQLVTTTKYLKDLLERREQCYNSSMAREAKLHQNVAIVERENESLKKLLKDKQELIADLGMDGNTKVQVSDIDEQLQSEMAFLKKIIVKLEKRFRDTLESNPYIRTTYPLNDRERKLVNQLMSRYRLKLRRKSSERSRSLSSHRSRRVSESPSVRTRHKRERSSERSHSRRESSSLTIRHKHERSSERAHTRRRSPSQRTRQKLERSSEISNTTRPASRMAETDEVNKQTENALKMMDYLFEN